MSGIGRRQAALAALAAGAMMIGGCAGTRGGPIAYDVQGFKAPDVALPSNLGETFTIVPGDTLGVAVFQADAISRDYQVDPSGNLAMPLIGQIKAVGLTTAQLQQAIASGLSKRYMRNPDVTVTLKQAAPRNVTVDGSVHAPGVFSINTPITLQQAVALARGTGEGANPRRVAVFRTIEGKRMAAAFDLTEIRRGQASDPQIYPGDIVVVDGSGTSAAFKNILQTLPLVALFKPF